VNNCNQRIDSLLVSAIEAGVAPGLVAMVAGRNGLMYSGCAGLRDIDRGIAMTTDTAFWIASFTKLVTSIAALTLVERGLLALDDPVDAILPTMADYQVLTGFDPDNAPVVRPPKRPITLRHLLSHTSGLGYEFADGMLLRARGEAGPPPPTSLASLRGPLRFDPGDGWVYGVGLDWVGLMIETVTGQSLDTYFQAEIFAPLGMNDTGFAVPTDRCAQLYQRTDTGVFASATSPVNDRGAWDFNPGGGGLFGTAGDFLHLLQALIDTDHQLLSANMIRSLFRVESREYRAGVIPIVVPGLNGHFDLFPDMHTGWSLGGMINPDSVPGGRRAGSLGWAGWANTYYWVDPDAGVCAVLMAQFVPFADPPMIATLRTFETEVYRSFGRRAH
jgi:methyl acetate hydrolase